MAKNTGNGSRIGIILNRSQVYNPKNKMFIKKNEKGQFMSTKETPYKAVRIENKSNMNLSEHSQSK